MTRFQDLIQAMWFIMYEVLGPLLVAIALMVFFLGIAKFLFKGGDEKALEEGKNIMLWGLIALFVMVSVWGLVFFIQRELNITQLTL